MDYQIKECARHEVKNFIEQWHYSKSINGVNSSYCFALFDGSEMIGAAIFGKLGMANNWKKFVDAPDKVLELRRLVCVDKAPRNTESYFIGRMLRWLRRFTEVEKIVSYADENHDHVGIIYQAANFDYLGKTSKTKYVIYRGKRYHDKSCRTTANGQLKPFAVELQQALKTGEAIIETGKIKHCYMYNLRRRKRDKNV